MGLISQTLIALEKTLTHRAQTLFQHELTQLSHIVQPKLLKLQPATVPTFQNKAILFFKHGSAPEMMPNPTPSTPGSDNNNPLYKLLAATALTIVGFIATKPLWEPLLIQLFQKDPETGTPVFEPKPATNSDDCIPRVMSILNENAKMDGEIRDRLKGKTITDKNLCDGFLSDLLWDLKDDPRISEDCLESFKNYWQEKCNRNFPHNGEMDAYK